MANILKLKGQWFIKKSFDYNEDAKITCGKCDFSNVNGSSCDIDALLDIPPCSPNGGNYLLKKFLLKKLLKNL